MLDSPIYMQLSCHEIYNKILRYRHVTGLETNAGAVWNSYIYKTVKQIQNAKHNCIQEQAKGQEIIKQQFKGKKILKKSQETRWDKKPEHQTKIQKAW